MTWLDIIIEALNKLGGSGKYSAIYNKVKDIAPDKVNDNIHWKDAIRRTIEEFSSDSKYFTHRKDVFYSVDGIGKGHWGLRNEYLDYECLEDYDIITTGSNHRCNYNISRIVRDTGLTRSLKRLHCNTCQLCGVRLQFDSDHYYSEGHHIKPLGGCHNGPDIAENIIILCPNCHTLCDYGAISLNKENIREIVGHSIAQQFIDYHNDYIYQNRL